jgi:hypothetical protein
MFRASLSLCAGLSLVLASCSKGDSKDSSQSAAVQQVKKPIVAVVPLIDHSHSGLNWNLSLELTRSIRENLLKHENLYLMGEDKVTGVLKKMHESHDPFGVNISWTKRLFPHDEFVVFMELARHDEVPLYTSKESSPQDSPAELNIMVRLRVIDLRGSEPKIVLQELVQNREQIPRQFNKSNFYQVPWGNEMFDISPLGMAHAQLTKEISSRIEDYILMSGAR